MKLINILCFVGGMAAYATARSMANCPCMKNLRERAMEKGREMSEKTKNVWEKIKHDAAEKSCSCAHEDTPTQDAM